MLKIKMACGFAAMVCALAAFSSPSFAFTEFTGKQGKIVKSSEQVLSVGTGIEVKCLSVTGSAGKQSTKQIKTILLFFLQCTVVGNTATITGCFIEFDVDPTASFEGNACTVKAGTCVLKIENAGNKELAEVNYTSLGTEKSELKANLAGITVVGTGGVCGIKTKAATYKGAVGLEGIGVA